MEGQSKHTNMWKEIWSDSAHSMSRYDSKKLNLFFFLAVFFVIFLAWVEVFVVS